MPRLFRSARFSRIGDALPRVARPLLWLFRDTVGAGSRLLLAVIVTGLATALLAVLLARHWWVFDLATHFRVHYVAVAAVGILLALVLRRRALAAAIVVLAVPHAVALTSLAPPGTAQAAVSQPANSVRVMTVNAYWANWDGTALVEHVARTDPDILVIQEAARQWKADLLRIGARYPHSVPEDWRSAHDVILFSRYPVADAESPVLDSRNFHHRSADLEIAGQIVTILGVHTPSPTNAIFADIRNRYFSAIAELAGASDRPMIVAGDFNSTVWSPHFADLIAASGLDNAADGRGWRPTWPIWLGTAGIPIDHILVSDEFTVQAVSRGPEVGSDHYPLTADLVLR